MRSHSGPLADQTATCSPGAKRSKSARATFSDSSSNSAKVQRRRKRSSRVPSISATRLGQIEAAVRSTSPTEDSRTGSPGSADSYDSDERSRFSSMTFYLHLALGTGATPEWMSNLCSDDYKNYFDHQ